MAAYHVDAFGEKVKYLNAKGFPVGLMRVGGETVLLILSDRVHVLDPVELVNTVNNLMGWRDGEWRE